MAARQAPGLGLAGRCPSGRQASLGPQETRRPRWLAIPPPGFDGAGPRASMPLLGRVQQAGGFAQPYAATSRTGPPAARTSASA